MIFGETPSDILGHHKGLGIEECDHCKIWLGLSLIIQNHDLRGVTDFVVFVLYDRDSIASAVRHFTVVGAYGFAFALF